MSVAGDLLDRMAEIGATVRPVGDRLIIRAGPKPVPGDLVRRVKEAKTELLAALSTGRSINPDERRGLAADAKAWRDRYAARIVHWFRVGRPWTRAESIAWGELQNRWHRLYGKRVPAWQCAGCREPIGGLAALDLADSNRVHFDDAHRLDCLLAYGARWRGTATRALAAMGLQPPADDETRPHHDRHRSPRSSARAAGRVGDRVSRRRKTVALIEAAAEILAAHHPMTLRQAFYRLVSRQVTENTRCAYQALSKALVAARCEGMIPWEWIEDRLWRPRHVSMWAGLADFGETAAAAYRRDTWAQQPRRVETWLEKDALSGIFEDALGAYGVTLNVGRGYDGWSSIHGAAQRLGAGDAVLYFGDFDPSGEDMVRSLGERLASLGSCPEIIKCALTLDDVRRYELPPDFTKATDTRRAAFVARWGDIAVELDALPLDVLRGRIVVEVECRMDLAALRRVRERETAERRELAAALGRLA